MSGATNGLRIQILVLDHRWVLVGALLDDGEESGIVEITHAHVVTRWGTTRGIGELVDGPTPKTRLGKLPPAEAGGTLRIPRGKVILPLPVCPERWAPAIGWTK